MQPFKYAIHSVIENPYVIMVKAKAVITFAQISNVLHVTLFHTPFASSNKVQMQRGQRTQYIQITHITNIVRCNLAAVSILAAVFNSCCKWLLAVFLLNQMGIFRALNAFVWNIIKTHSTVCSLYLHGDCGVFL